MATAQTSSGVRDRNELYIAGTWVQPSGDGYIEVPNPATEEVVARVPRPEIADADRALAAARKAFDEGPWPRMSIRERAEILSELAELVERRLDDFTHTFSIESGAPLALSRGFAQSPVLSLRDTTALAERVELEVERANSEARVKVVQEPVGVVLSIAPWNGPISLAALKLVPALLAGCTVVHKPSEEVPLVTYLLADLIDELGLPEGVVSIVPGGREFGEHMVRHPAVDKVTFTGSTAAGRRIMSVCGERITRVSLELGGKSPAIIADDVEMADVASSLTWACIMHSGQVCCAITRALVPEQRHDELVEALVEEMKAVQVGDPLDPETQLGPLTMARQRDRVESYFELARQEGATIACGGRRPPHLDRGYYVEPTVLANVENSMRVAREEIFGPVLCVIPYKDIDDAIRIANDSDYGLAGAVYTHDPVLGEQIARRVRTGQISISGYGTCVTHPFGGYKQSGIGREGGMDGLGLFLETKVINYTPALPIAGAA